MLSGEALISRYKKNYFACLSTRLRNTGFNQTGKEQLLLSYEHQHHEHLVFVSAAFKNAEHKWTTFEKEGFAIFQTFEKLDYMISGHEDVRVFTDHRNLLFVFAPLSLEPALGRHVFSDVLRWALYLSRFEYSIKHVAGEENAFADILMRCTRGYRGQKSYLQHVLGQFRTADSTRQRVYVAGPRLVS